MTSRALVVACGVAVLLNLSPAASADRRVDRDERTPRTSLDIEKAAHSHGHSHRYVVHFVRMYHRWRSEEVRRRKGGVGIWLDFHTPQIERRIAVRYVHGRLQAFLFAGKHAYRPKEADIDVWRPNRHSVTIGFDADILRHGIDNYRWWVTTGLSGPIGCIPEDPCWDVAGGMRHEL